MSELDPQQTKRDGNSVRRRAWWLPALKAVLAAGIIGWLCTGPLNMRLLSGVLGSGHLAFLGAIVFASMFLPAIRWYWLLRIQRLNVTLWAVVRMTWIGYVTGLILPGAVSGDLAKGYLVLRDQPEGRARGLSTVLVDRFIGLYTMMTLGVVAAARFEAMYQTTAAVHAMLAGLLVLLTGATSGAVALLVAPVRRVLARVVPTTLAAAGTESYRLYVNAKLALTGCLVLSLASSAVTAMSLAAADRTLSGNVSWTASLVAGPLVILANSLPITPGGIGVAEATSSQLFAVLGSTNGAEMMLVLRLAMTVLSLPAVLLLFTRQPVRLTSSSGPADTACDEASHVDARSESRRAA
ncbi:MAG TPA: lysylphosphatidylglycerol synthase transmembrane domain-containing protein [Lacipirellulaceae bacterium]|nr:lysylphosphatidylglycerol synthase transmembrane domain-containing protein [Lacipirellulaceae bacterium]